MIEVSPMVCTKADVSVHQSIFIHHVDLHQEILIHNLRHNKFPSNNHHHDNTHANHHHLQDILYETFHMKIFLTRRNSTTPSIQKKAPKKGLMMEGWHMEEALGGWPILIPKGERDSLFLTRIGEGETKDLRV